MFCIAAGGETRRALVLRRMPGEVLGGLVNAVMVGTMGVNCYLTVRVFFWGIGATGRDARRQDVRWVVGGVEGRLASSVLFPCYCVICLGLSHWCGDPRSAAFRGLKPPPMPPVRL